MNYSDKTCFVITGFGKKKDRDTSRILDLDKTFKYLIQPVFEELGITCNRASELVHNQIIDVPMYEQILQADVVVADISTLNPNAIYELGVRHALRPHSTIIIAEDKLNFPFDFSHNFVLTYTHMGDDIGMSAVEEFRPKLKKLVKTILDSPAVDSPVYTFLQKLQPPSMSESPKRNKMVARYKREDSSIEVNEEILIPSESGTNQDLSLDELRTRGDQALFAKEFVEAIQYYRRGQELSPHDEYFTHQLCIATYRQPHSSAEEAMEHFQAAETILQRLHPETSTHPETLGLMGSINKRKFEVSPRPEYLTTSIQYYSRGFSLNHNYYNGINLAYMHIQQAVTASSSRKAMASWYSADKVWEKILTVTTDLLEQEDQKRTNSKHWILQARAQALLGLGQTEAFEETSQQALEATPNAFSTDMYKQYNQRLKEMLEVLRERFPEE